MVDSVHGKEGKERKKERKDRSFNILREKWGGTL